MSQPLHAGALQPAVLTDVLLDIPLKQKSIDFFSVKRPVELGARIRSPQNGYPGRIPVFEHRIIDDFDHPQRVLLACPNGLYDGLGLVTQPAANRLE
jgi:hypothetical protein